MNRLNPCFKACLVHYAELLRDVFTFGTVFLAYLIKNLIWLVIGREKSFESDIVLITGSGGYLGRNLAKEFAKRKATIVLWDINEAGNLATQEELNRLGFSKVHAYKVDVTNEKELKAAAYRVRNEVGEVSVVAMAAAPTFKPRSILETNYAEDIEKHFKISYLAQLWLIQEFLKPMIERNKGHFLQISSASAFADIPLISSYASFKLAQTKLLETMREELAANGINGVKTTIAFLAILKGGLADGFYDSYQFDDNILIRGEDAAANIVRAVANNKEYYFMPFEMRYFMLMKFLLSPRLFGDFALLKTNLNPAYLKLKHLLNLQK